MNQDSLKDLFRTQELQRRADRMKALMINHAKLADEIDNPEIIGLDKGIAENITRQQVYHDKILRPNYWKRLWAALWNK